jgi:hypothetical protein
VKNSIEIPKISKEIDNSTIICVILTKNRCFF